MQPDPSRIEAELEQLSPIPRLADGQEGVTQGPRSSPSRMSPLWNIVTNFRGGRRSLRKMKSAPLPP
jgi:hypothetical protein